MTQKPIINAGDGSNEHPTQALGDLYTIWKCFGSIDGLTIVIASDHAHSRATHSFVKALSQFSVQIVLVVLPELEPPKNVIEVLEAGVASWEIAHDLRTVVARADVLYLGSFCYYRINDPMERDRLRAGFFCTNLKMLEHAKPTLKILHPLPRYEELDPEIDSHPAAAYFEQAKNGTYVRMALLERLIQDK